MFLLSALLSWFSSRRQDSKELQNTTVRTFVELKKKEKKDSAGWENGCIKGPLYSKLSSREVKGRYWTASIERLTNDLAHFQQQANHHTQRTVSLAADWSKI
jgi:hypothetical protein